MKTFTMNCTLPKELNNKQCERFEPIRMGGVPSIRFVPESTYSSEDADDDKDERVKISVTDTIQKNVKVFKEGGAEAVIQLIRLHESIVADRKLEESYNSASSLINAKKTQMRTLGRNDNEEKAGLVTAISELKATCKSVQEEAYHLFEKLLDQSLVPKWREIVKEQCDEGGYIDLNGRKKTQKRGRNFLALKACYTQVLLQVAPQDAAERHRRYISNTVRKHESVSCPQLISRLMQLNEMTSYLPCMKQMEDSPPEMPKMNVPFSELEMCTHVIAALPIDLSVAYWATKGMHFPISLKKLQEDLKRVEAQHKRNAHAIDQLRIKAGIPSKKSGDQSKGKGPHKMSGPDDKIPKKGKRNIDAAADAVGGPKNSNRRQKHCTMCAQWSPGIKHTHNTRECRKWNKDGSAQQHKAPHGNFKSNYANSQGGGGFAEAFEEMRKEQKSLRKLMTKRSSRKGSRKRSRRYRYESSDDSSSGEE